MCPEILIFNKDNFIFVIKWHKIFPNCKKKSENLSWYKKILLFFYHATQKNSGFLANFRIAMLPCYRGFSLSGYRSSSTRTWEGAERADSHSWTNCGICIVVIVTVTVRAYEIDHKLPGKLKNSIGTQLFCCFFQSLHHIPVGSSWGGCAGFTISHNIPFDFKMLQLKTVAKERSRCEENGCVVGVALASRGDVVHK